MIERVPVGRGEYEDGSRRVYEGTSLQRRQAATEFTNREQRSEQLYDLFAQPGFRARGQDQVMVEPGPVEDDGVTPARLNLVGPADPQIRDGREHSVIAVVRRRIG